MLLQSEVSASELSKDQENETDERWFEVEVILYKSTSDKGLINESWDRDIVFTLPENHIDFLNPVEQLNLEELQANSGEFDTNKEGSYGKTFQSIPNQPQQDITTELSVDSHQVEQPFQKLSEDYLQLSKEAKRISVNPNFRLLNHFAWRQPVAGRSDAISVRLAGGHDYQELFDFNGTKRLEPIISAEENSQYLSTETNEQFIDDIRPSTETIIQTDINSDLEVRQNEIGSDKEISLLAKRLPWVPELDGSAIVYIYRNYLHFDTKVFYRKPDKEEVDFLNLSSLNPPSELNSSLSLDEILNKNEQTETIPSTEDNSLTWHYDDSFLNQDTEKIYTERLFNYPLIQTRRLRSTELHYFDHPLIGILVMIRPYELENASNNSKK